jgi:hypothetical protein
MKGRKHYFLHDLCGPRQINQIPIASHNWKSVNQRQESSIKELNKGVDLCILNTGWIVARGLLALCKQYINIPFCMNTKLSSRSWNVQCMPYAQHKIGVYQKLTTKPSFLSTTRNRKYRRHLGITSCVSCTAISVGNTILPNCQTRVLTKLLWGDEYKKKGKSYLERQLSILK